MFGVISPSLRSIGGSGVKREYAASRSGCKCLEEVESQGREGNVCDQSIDWKKNIGTYQVHSYT